MNAPNGGPSLIKLVRRVLRTSTYLVINLVGMPIQLVALGVSKKWPLLIPLHYHRLCLKLFGIRVTVRGQMSTQAPVLFVSNHVSYLDIPVLASLVPGSFVAKKEVAAWPLFGWLAKLQRTVFVSRRNREVNEQNNEIAERLGAGGNLIVFPEGTNTDGNHVDPFHTSVFQVAVDYAKQRPLLVQPVSINCLAIEGVTAGRTGRQVYSWYGVSNNVSTHLWRFMGFGNCLIQVEFHPPLDPARFPGRKQLALAAESAVRAGISANNRGQGMPPPEVKY